MTMAEMAVQTPEKSASPAGERARFFNSGNAFNIQLPPVPDHVFTAERDRVLDSDAPTGFVPCDLSGELDSHGPATTPLVLARYARIRPREELRVNLVATGSIWYVISGNGITDCGTERFEWGSGDVFVLPGGGEQNLSAGDEGAVLWLATNEPHLTFEGFRPQGADVASTAPVHYPAAEIESQLARIYDVAQGDETAGLALVFSSESEAYRRNALPTLTLALNSLPAGEVQRAHKHNSVAVSLIVQGEDCYSMVDGTRKDWSPWATTVTPPGAVHSHHNEGGKKALFLIVQDGGLYYHARTMGFEFA